MIDLTELLSSIITLGFSLITAFLIPYIRKQLTNEQLKELDFWMNVGVKSAEMIYAEKGKGSEKKEFVKSFLAQRGFNLDPDVLEDLIESGVHDLNKKNLAE